MRKTYIFLLLLAVSCQDKGQSDVVNMEDLIPEMQESTVPLDSLPKSIQYYDSLPSSTKLLLDSLYMNKESLQPWDTTLYVERFSAKSSEKWQWESVNQSPMYFHSATYKDSLSAKNAFFNWLDCFSSRCNSVQLFEEKGLNKQPFGIVLSDKHLWYFTGEENFDFEWYLVKIAELYPKEKILFVLSQKKGRKSTWWELVEEKWTIIKKKK